MDPVGYDAPLLEPGLDDVHEPGRAAQIEVPIPVRTEERRDDFLIDEAAHFAEAWNQRAVAEFALRRFEDAANDCHQTLEMNAYHFGAAVGMGHCYLQLDEPFAALENFRRALALNPDLEEVRGQINFLERALEGR